MTTNYAIVSQVASELREEGIPVAISINWVEALGYLATLDSFRGAPPEAMVRAGATSAVIRAEGAVESREVLLEAATRDQRQRQYSPHASPLSYPARRARELQTKS